MTRDTVTSLYLLRRVQVTSSARSMPELTSGTLSALGGALKGTYRIVASVPAIIGFQLPLETDASSSQLTTYLLSSPGTSQPIRASPHVVAVTGTPSTSTISSPLRSTFAAGTPGTRDSTVHPLSAMPKAVLNGDWPARGSEASMTSCLSAQA